MDFTLSYFTWVSAWVAAHPELAGAALVFALLLIYSFVPRKPPKNPTLFLLWSIFERVTFMTWEKWGGPFKSIGIISPNPDEWASEQPTKKETPAKE